jgi:hypothetical protein
MNHAKKTFSAEMFSGAIISMIQCLALYGILVCEPHAQSAFMLPLSMYSTKNVAVATAAPISTYKQLTRLVKRLTQPSCRAQALLMQPQTTVSGLQQRFAALRL